MVIGVDSDSGVNKARASDVNQLVMWTGFMIEMGLVTWRDCVIGSRGWVIGRFEGMGSEVMEAGCRHGQTMGNGGSSSSEDTGGMIVIRRGEMAAGGGCFGSGVEGTNYIINNVAVNGNGGVCVTRGREG